MHSRSRKIIYRLAIGLSLIGLSGCLHPAGLLFTAVDSPGYATAQPRGTKVGKACAVSVLGIIAVGDNSIHRARQNGRITKIFQVDRDTLSILGGVYSQICYTVKGR